MDTNIPMIEEVVFSLSMVGIVLLATYFVTRQNK